MVQHLKCCIFSKGWDVESYVIAGWLKFFWFAKASYQFWNRNFTLRSNVAKNLIEASERSLFAVDLRFHLLQSFLTILRAKPVFTAPFAFCNGFFRMECRRGMNAFRLTNARGNPVFVGNPIFTITRSNIRSSLRSASNSLRRSKNQWSSYKRLKALKKLDVRQSRCNLEWVKLENLLKWSSSFIQRPLSSEKRLFWTPKTNFSAEIPSNYSQKLKFSIANNSYRKSPWESEALPNFTGFSNDWTYEMPQSCHIFNFNYVNSI